MSNKTDSNEQGPSELVIIDSGRNTVGFLTSSGICFLSRVWFYVVLFVAAAFIFLKIWDRFLGGPTVDLKEWQDFALSGFLGKLDDVSFWTALVGLFSGSLVLSACLRVFHIKSEFPLVVTRFHLRLWLVFTLFGWAVYFFAIYMPSDDKGTFFSILSPEKRWAQILEGLLNLWLIAVAYFLAVVSATVALAIQKELRSFGNTSPTTNEDKALAGQWLMAGSLVRNVPFLFIPVISCVYVILISVYLLGDKVIKPHFWPSLDFEKYGFHPLSGLLKQWPLVIFNFVLLMLPFCISAIIVRRPSWALRSFIFSKKRPGGFFFDKVLLKTKSCDERMIEEAVRMGSG